MENQLSPNLISLSLLTTTHPSILPHTRVQSYHLVIVRSFGFGSYSTNLKHCTYFYSEYILFTIPVLISLNFLIFKYACTINSPTHYTKGTLSYLHGFLSCLVNLAIDKLQARAKSPPQYSSRY